MRDLTTSKARWPPGKRERHLSLTRLSRALTKRYRGCANLAAGASGIPYLPRMDGSGPSQGAACPANRRAISRRHVVAWICRTIVALLAAVYAAGLNASAAVTGQVPVTLRYSCQLPIVGGTALTTKFVWPSGLRTTTVDTRTPSLPVDVAATVGSAARTVVSVVGIEWIEGTADVRVDIKAPQGNISEKVKFTVPRTNVSTGSGPLTVSATGSTRPVLLSQTGQAKVVVGVVRPPLHPDRDRGLEQPWEHQLLLQAGFRPIRRGVVGADPPRRLLGATVFVHCASAPAPDPGSDANPGSDPNPGTDPNPDSDPSPDSDPGPLRRPASGHEFQPWPAQRLRNGAAPLHAARALFPRLPAAGPVPPVRGRPGHRQSRTEIFHHGPGRHCQESVHEEVTARASPTLTRADPRTREDIKSKRTTRHPITCSTAFRDRSPRKHAGMLPRSLDYSREA